MPLLIASVSVPLAPFTVDGVGANRGTDTLREIDRHFLRLETCEIFPIKTL